MSKDKKSKKNGIDKVREILDDIPLENLDIKDEKYLIALKKRLNKPEQTIIFSQKDQTNEIDIMKPKVLIHVKKEQKITIIKEEADKKTEIQYTKKTEGFIDDEMFEVEKVKVDIPEFVEVKPIEKITDEKETIEIGDKKTIKESELKEWQPVESEEKKEIEDKTREELEAVHFCSNCGFKIQDKRNFCPKCGQSLITEKEEKPVSIESIKSVEKSKEKLLWKPVELDKKEGEKEKIAEDLDEKIQIFKEIESIDDNTAIILYDHGYTSVDLLSSVTVKDLRKIKGIKKKKAKEIINELTQIVEEFEEKPDEIKPIPVGETAVVEVTEEQIVTEDNSISDEEKIKAFKDMNSIDNQTAILLYNSGYTSFDLLRDTTIKDLKKLKGLKRKTAKNIIFEIKNKIQEKSKVMPISINVTSEEKLSDDEIKIETEENEAKTSKPSSVELQTKTSEWTPVKEEQIWEPVEDEKKQLEEKDFEDINRKIEPFKNIKSIDEETAVTLYDNGYTSIDNLLAATVKDLSKIKGLKKKKVKIIKKEIQEKTDWETPIVKQEYKEKNKDDDFLKQGDESFIEEKLKEQQIAESETMINNFNEFESIDDKIAILLYNNGFTNVESLKNVNVKDLTRIKGIKRKTAKKIIEELKIKFPEEKTFIEEKKVYFEDEAEKINGELDIYKEPEPVEQVVIEEEIIEDNLKVKTDEEQKVNPFINIKSINKKINKLLIENGITSIDEIYKLTIKDLIKIKGIRKKVAKKIKQEVKEEVKKTLEPQEVKYENDDKTYIKDEITEEDEWQSYDEDDIKDEKIPDKQGFRHEDYTLYEKEMELKSGGKRIVRFFSKGEPEQSKPIKLPKGYEVKENKKTGVPYLRKKK